MVIKSLAGTAVHFVLLHVQLLGQANGSSLALHRKLWRGLRFHLISLRHHCICKRVGNSYLLTSVAEMALRHAS
jgi:hypothetical protein